MSSSRLGVGTAGEEEAAAGLESARAGCGAAARSAGPVGGGVARRAASEGCPLSLIVDDGDPKPLLELD